MRYIVTAVGERNDCIEYLKEHIPNLEVVWDEKKDALDTFLRAMKHTGASPAVHLEDDIILTSDFQKKIEAAIATKPNELIQFFSMRKADLEIGSRWDSNYLMNQCYYTPPFWCIRFLKWMEGQGANYEEIKAKWNNGTDTSINAYMKAIKKRYWIHVPSLVDHRVGKSMIDSRRASTNRQSFTFLP